MRRRMLASIGGGAKPWVNPYITDGAPLAAMWDGEWNAGGGLHDPTAGLCEIVNGKWNFPLVGSATIEDKSIRLAKTDSIDININGAELMSIIEGAFPSGPGFSLEATFSVTSQVPNRVPAFIIAGYNENIFGFATFFAIDSHPTYSETSLNVNILGNKPSGTYKKINIPSVVHFVWAVGGGYADSYVNGSILRNEYAQGNATEYGEDAYRMLRLNFRGAYAGDIYGIRMYTKKLTQAEVTDRYNIERERYGLA